MISLIMSIAVLVFTSLLAVSEIFKFIRSIRLGLIALILLLSIIGIASNHIESKRAEKRREIQSLWQTAIVRDDSLRHLYIECFLKNEAVFAHLYPFQITLEIESPKTADPYFKISYDIRHTGRPGEHNRISQYSITRTVCTSSGERKEEYCIARPATKNNSFRIELKDEAPLLRTLRDVVDTRVKVGLSSNLFYGLEKLRFVANEWPLISCRTDKEKWTGNNLKERRVALSERCEPLEILKPNDNYSQDASQDSRGYESLSDKNVCFELYTDIPSPFNVSPSEYDAAIEKNPQDDYALQQRGNAYLREGQVDLAIQDYNRALEVDPKIVQILFNLGLIYLQQGSNALAKDYCLKAIAIDPEKDKAYGVIGFASMGLGLYADAITYLSKSLQLFPDDIQALENRGFAYRQMGEYQKALEDYRKVIELNPEHTATLLNLGCLYCQLGQYSDSIFYYEKAQSKGVLSLDDQIKLAEAWGCLQMQQKREKGSFP